MFLNYILNYNLTSLVLVQYSFNFSLDIFEIPFIYAVFTSFRRFYLFNFKFKKVHVFVGDQTPTEQFCLRNFFYTIKFTCFSPSFLYLLSRQIIYYVIWNILQCHSLTQEKSCKQDSPSAAGSFSDIIPLHSSALLPGRLYFLCAFMYVIGTLQSNLL